MGEYRCPISVICVHFSRWFRYITQFISLDFAYIPNFTAIILATSTSPVNTTSTICWLRQLAPRAASLHWPPAGLDKLKLGESHFYIKWNQAIVQKCIPLKSINSKSKNIKSEKWNVVGQGEATVLVVMWMAGVACIKEVKMLVAQMVG